MQKYWGALIALAIMPGCNETEESVCDSLCRELVQSCGYAAYPDLDSCRQGCEYASEQGSDIVGQQHGRISMFLGGGAFPNSLR